MDFVAIDFETANSRRGSACAIGAVRVVDGRIEDSFYSLCQPAPEHNFFEPMNIAIHGITPQMASSAPTFDQVFTQFESFRNGLPFVAHNASFDMSVLRNTLNGFGLLAPKADYACTLVLARKALTLISYSLPYVAEELSVSLEHHHDALADAKACAEIAVSLADRYKVSTLDAMLAALNIQMGLIDGNSWQATSARRHHVATSWKDIDLEIPTDPENYLFGKAVAFTGTLPSDLSRPLAQAYVNAIGGTPQSGVNKKTDILVIGDLDLSTLKPGAEKSSKWVRAEELLAQGQNIEVMTGQELLAHLPLD